MRNNIDNPEQPPTNGQNTPSLGPRVEDNDPLLTARQVADLLAVPESWVREATRDGRLPHLTLGRYRRYSRQAIAAWLEQQHAGPPVPGRKSRPDLHPDPHSSL